MVPLILGNPLCNCQEVIDLADVELSSRDVEVRIGSRVGAAVYSLGIRELDYGILSLACHGSLKSIQGLLGEGVDINECLYRKRKFLLDYLRLL